MRGFSKAVIAGNLTRDPELRTTTTGRSVCSFTVAVNRPRRDASGSQTDDTMFVNCSAWGSTGETINKYLHKGDAILVSGRLRQEEWEGRDGQKHVNIVIDVDDFNFIGGGRSSDGASSYSGASASSSSSSAGNSTSASSDSTTPTDIPEGEINLDDVPF